MFEKTMETYQFPAGSAAFFEALKESSGPFAPYLSKEYLKSVNDAWIGLDCEAFEALLHAAEEIKKQPALLELAASVRDLLFDDSLSVDYLVHLGFPKPHTGDRGLDAFFGLLVHLSGIDVVKARYEKRNIPLSYMKASYKSVKIWVESFKQFYGYYGHDRECPRMLYIENFRFIRIGRLEYEPKAFYGQAVVLQNRKDGSYKLLASGGTLFRPDGKIDGTNEVYDPQSKAAYYEETADAVTGNEIINGRIRPDIVCLPKTEWEAVLRPGDSCINSHIPRDGKLNPKDAEDSFLEAEHFFQTYFPEIGFRFFQCHSWLLDDVYPELLGKDSGIVQFQSLFLPFPVRSTDFGAMISVFTEAPFKLDEWAPTTTLQRKIKEFYAQDGKLCNGGGVRPIRNF